MRLPRVLGAVVVMATVVTLSSVVPSQASSSKTPYLIASPIDLTGSQAALGASLCRPQCRRGPDQWFWRNFGHPVKVTYKDTQSTAQTAGQVLTSMLQSGGYIAAIPASGGATTLPMLQVMKSNKILGLLVGSAPDLGNPKVYPTIFDVASSYASSGTALVCAATFHPKTAAIIQLDDPFNATDSATATLCWPRWGSTWSIMRSTNSERRTSFPRCRKSKQRIHRSS